MQDPGFSNPIGYVTRTAIWLDRFHILPEPGGLNDQPLDWVEDMELYFGMDAQTEREYREYVKNNADGS